MHDPLGDRCKALEWAQEGPPLTTAAWIVARIDGRGFSKLTQSITKPYDTRMANAMEAAAVHVMDSFGAVAAYHQSDEITLFWTVEDACDLLFEGRRSKWISLLASSTTAAFMRALDREGLSELADALPHMDARVRGYSSIDGPADTLAWRAQDARRNAIQGAAQQHFSQRDLNGLSLQRLREKLEAIGLPFDTSYPEAFRNGTLLMHTVRYAALEEAERMAIPEHVRPTPDDVFLRRAITPNTATLPEDPVFAAALLQGAAASSAKHRARRKEERATRKAEKDQPKTETFAG